MTRSRSLTAPALCALVFLALAVPGTLAQQKAATQALAPPTIAASDSLLRLPPVEVIFRVRVSRLFREAIPVIFSRRRALISEMNAGLNQLQAMSGIDPRLIDTVTLGMRAKHGVAFDPNSFDYVMLVEGRYDVNNVITLARLASQGKFRETVLRGTTIYTFDVAGMMPKLPARQSQAYPVAISFAALDERTLAIGVPSMVQSVISNMKSESNVYLNDDLNEMLARNKTAIIDVAGYVPPAFSEQMSKYSALVPSLPSSTVDEALPLPDPAETLRLMSTVNQFYFAVGAEAGQLNIILRARTATPEQAAALGATFRSLQQFMNTKINDALGRQILQQMRFQASGREVEATSVLPQAALETIIAEVEKNMAAAYASAQKAASDKSKVSSPPRRRARQ